MSFSIQNEKFHVHLDKGNTALSMLLGARGSLARHKSLQSRLAQNPDISKHELNALLRGFICKKPAKSQNNYWTAMLAHVSQSTANSNNRAA